MHSIFIQVPKGNVAMVDEIPPLKEAEMLNGIIYLNNTNILGCIIALKNTDETEILISGLISSSHLQAKCTFPVTFSGFTPLESSLLPM